LRGITKYFTLALLCILVSLVIWDFLFWNGRFPPNYHIEKVDVSGLSNYEAYNKLKSADVDRAVSGPIYLGLEGEALTYKPSAVGAYISPGKTIKSLKTAAYRSNYFVDLANRLLGKYKNEAATLSLELDGDTFKAVLEGLANNIDEPSREATFTLLENGMYKVTKEKIGKQLNIKRSIANLRDALYNDRRAATVEVTLLYPRVYAKALVKYPPKHLLAEYTTYYGSHDSPNRVHNIKVASGRINNHIMISGETFSLLDKLGEFNQKRGFKEAFVIYNGELAPQYGGGSCQIATTLYNAALMAGLNIVERHNHGIYFTIYPLGRDASIYSGSSDLKIMNNSNHPILIKGIATDKKLTFRLYGTPFAKKISFSRPVILFNNEKYARYDIMSDEARAKITEALFSGKPFSTQIRIIQEEGGYSNEKIIRSYYKFAGDRENVKIVRPEPDQ
jgi:vancomycin resistance protein YoaR